MDSLILTEKNSRAIHSGPVAKWHMREARPTELKAGFSADAWRIVSSSLQYALEPSEIKWKVIIRKSEWKVAFKLAQDLPNRRVKTDVSHCNSLISASHHWFDALSRFQSLVPAYQPDIVTFNALAGCLGSRWDLALDIIREAQSSSQQIERITFHAVLKSLSEVDSDSVNIVNSRWSLGLANIAMMNSQGISLHRSTFTHVLQAMSLSAQWCQLLQYLPHLRRFGCDLVCCNVVVHACSKALQWKGAMKLLCTFPQLFVRPDAISYNVLTDGNWRHASVFLQEMTSGSIRATTKWYNRAGHIASGHGAGGTWAKTVCFFQSAQAQIHPDTVTLNTCLLHLSVQKWDWALLWWTQMEAQVRGDQLTNTLLTSIKTWRESLSFLQQIRWRRQEPSQMICSAAIKTMEESACWTSAFNLLHVNADVTSYSATTACLQYENWPKSLCLMQTASKAGLQHDVISLNSGLGTLGPRWDLAAKVFESISTAELQASQANYCSVLHLLHESLATSTAVQSIAWQNALDSFSSFHVAGVQRDTASYNALLASCEKCARWCECLCLMETMGEIKDQLPDELSFEAAICTLSETNLHPNFCSCQSCLLVLIVLRALALVVSCCLANLRCLWEGWVGSCQLQHGQWPKGKLDGNGCMLCRSCSKHTMQDFLFTARQSI